VKVVYKKKEVKVVLSNRLEREERLKLDPKRIKSEKIDTV
jgi:hypothetical protein